MRLRDPLSWVLLVGRARISLLDGFTQSFKKFKDGFFRVRVLPVGRLLYYDDEGRPKFPFYWMSAPAVGTRWLRRLWMWIAEGWWRCWRCYRLGCRGNGLFAVI